MSSEPGRAPLTILVIGGSGFVGRAVLAELQDLAAAEQRALTLRSLDKVAPKSARAGVAYFEGDITVPASLVEALAGVDVVVHTASLVDWGVRRREVVLRVNVEGTRNVVAACRAAGARALVYTSSIDALFDGSDHVDVDETAPYPGRWLDAYCESKALAEQLVISESDGALRTCALRPCGVFGPDDPHHMDNVLGSARAGKLVMRVGDGSSVYEHGYVGNVAHAHARAALSLAESSTPLAGEIYFCVDEHRAVNFFDFVAPFVEGLGYAMPPRSRYLPGALALAIGTPAGALARALSPIVSLRPAMTRSSVIVLLRSCSVRSDKLARAIGYAPPYSPQQALERTVASYRGAGWAAR